MRCMTSPSPEPPGHCPMRMSSRSSSPRWKVSRRGGPTGAPARWRSALASVPSTVGRIWRTFGLQPHVVASFKISDDPLFLEKVRDSRPLPESTRPRRCLVIRRKASDQALERAQPSCRWTWVGPERQSRSRPPHNYIRHGTVDLFAALNVATGQVVAHTKKQSVEGFRERSARDRRAGGPHPHRPRAPRQSLGA